MTGDTSERALFLCYGTGANGKSTLLETLYELAGDYARRTPTETLLTRNKDANAVSNDVARLKGARFVYASESEQGRRLGEAFIKDITSGDAITARFLHAEHFEFKPECKLWLATNHKPAIKGTDDAIWARLKLIPFTVTIPEERQIPRRTMQPKLRAEFPGILAWAVRGCQEWLRDGLGAPPEVVRAGSRYRAEMDTLGSFIDDCCVTGTLFRASARQLYAAYSEWSRTSGENPMSQKQFGIRLEERGYTRMHRDSGNWYEAIGLRAGLKGTEETEQRPGILPLDTPYVEICQSTVQYPSGTSERDEIEI